MHFSAFHPDFKMRNTPATPRETLVKARQLAMSTGLRYVYTGNVHHVEGDTTYCHHCGEVLIERDWYQLNKWQLGSDGTCLNCGAPCSGVFDSQPGSWGRQRLQVRF